MFKNDNEKALDLLVQEGLLYRKEDKAALLCLATTQKGKSLFLKENYKVSLNQAKEMSLKILEFKLEFANEEIANNLNINVDDQFIIFSDLDLSIISLMFLKEPICQQV